MATQSKDKETKNRETPAQPIPRRDIEKLLIAAMEDQDEGASTAVDIMLSQGAYHGASDLHLEPWTERMTLRFRIDGMLQDIASLPKEYQSRLTARLKVLADMKVYQREMPQDGRIDSDQTSCQLEMRVSSFPTVCGEKMVVRMMGATHDLMELGQLGFPNDITKRLRDLIARPQGTLLLTGPSSSGKTTTIYALLRQIKSRPEAAQHIMTVEDPVEFQLDGVAQAQVNMQTGFTFATALRAMLRQDPEVLVVGEIRDTDTAQIAVQAGLTGHLVISTIHCGTAPGAFTRLLDMGIEPYLVASSVTGVLSQRLVRMNCANCTAEYTPEPEHIAEFGLENADMRYYRGTGCSECREIGYRGRTAIGELITMRNEYAQVILEHGTTQRLTEAARQLKVPTLLDCGLAKVRSGLTTLAEIKRVLPPPDAD